MKLKILKPLIAFALLVLIFSFVDFTQLWAALSNLTWPLAILLLLISVVLIYVSAFKWGLFLKVFNHQESTLKLFKLYLLGYFVNSFFPSFVGGDAARSWFISQKGVRHQAFAATIMERLTGLFAMLLLAIVFYFFTDLPISYFYSLLVLFFGLLAVCVFSFKFNLERFHFKKKWLSKVQSKIADLRLALSELAKHPRVLIESMLYSFVFHSFTVLNTIIAGIAVGWFGAPVAELYVVLPLILLIGFIPITPSGLGLQEGAFFFFLTQLGSTPEQAVALSLVLRAKQLILAALGSLVFMANK